MAQTQNVQQRMREDIVSGALPFGSRVTIADLSARYKVSHMPIREALRGLHGEGLLILETDRGASIKKVDRNFVMNIFDLRLSLEVLTIRGMVRRCSQEQLRRLEDIQARFEAAVASGDFAAALAANHDLHEAVAWMAQNQDAALMLGRHRLLVSALWRGYGYGPERFPGVIEDHRHILEAIRCRDVEGAAWLAGAHLVKARQALLSHMPEAA